MISAENASVTLFVVGDVFANMPNPEQAFAQVSPLLRTADVVAGNCEGVYADNPSLSPSHKHAMVAPLSRGATLGSVPFHLLSCSNNHMLDAGYSGLDEHLGLLQAQGIRTVGVGRDLAEASAPVIVERNGLRIAFVAFCSVFPVGYEARPARGGIAALRVLTHYSQRDPNFWEPGIPGRITTEILAEDREVFRNAIADARKQADIVVVLGHWGYSSARETLQDYEKDLAHCAVDAGADAVICCHHHSLRGVEINQGRPIFYGMGAFMHHFLTDEKTRRHRAERDGFEFEPQFVYYPFHPDARMTGVATLELAADGVIRAGFVPAQIKADGSTEPLRWADPRAAAVVAYLRRITSESGFSTKFDEREWQGWAWLVVDLGS